MSIPHHISADAPDLDAPLPLMDPADTNQSSNTLTQAETITQEAIAHTISIVVDTSTLDDLTKSLAVQTMVSTKAKEHYIATLAEIEELRTNLQHQEVELLAQFDTTLKEKANEYTHTLQAKEE